MGRKDLLAPHLDSLVRLLGGKGGDDDWVRAGEVSPNEAACWEPVLAARTLWQELGLDDILDGCEGRRTQHTSLADRAFVLVAGRLCCPGSEHGLASWLERDYVCDRKGRRWLPQWEQHDRVQVNLTWLRQWYRTLDELRKNKEKID